MRRLRRLANPRLTAAPRPSPARLAWALAAAALLGVAPARADAIQVGGIWTDVDRVVGVERGQLAFVSNQGRELSQPLDRVQGVRLDAAPELEAGVAALAAGDAARALQLLGVARDKVTTDELRALVDWELMRAAAAAGDGQRVADRLIALVTANADDALVTDPPVRAVSALDAAARERIVAQARAAARRADPVGQRALDALVAAAQSPAQPPAAAGQAVAPQAAAEVESAVVLPEGLPGDPTVTALREGRFADAIDDTTARLQSSGGALSRDLYLDGIAKLYHALETQNPAGYKDAGLSLMRVAIHFPRSRWSGYALAEAGYVHQLIGRPDLARPLYDQALIQIDPDQDPAYAQRVAEFVRSLPPIDGDAGANP